MLKKDISHGVPTRSVTIYQIEAWIKWHTSADKIGFGDNTDLLWWNNVNNQFCQLTTRVS